MKAKLILSAFLLAISLAALSAAQSSGTVRAVSGDVATVGLEGDTPTVGDGAELFFKLPGGDDEISVASGTVVAVESGIAKVKIAEATGEVAKDHLVRFTPGKSPRPAPVAASPPASAPPSLAASPAADAGYIGVQLSEAPDQASGARVIEVIADGPAAQAGILPNDVIMAMDGLPVENATQLSEGTAPLAPGSRHALLVSRAGKLQKIEVTIGARPADFSPPSATSQGTIPPSVPFPSVAPGEKTSSVPSGDSSADAIAAPFVGKGNAQYAAGNFDGAIASYTEGIRAAPSVATLYLNRANAYLYKPNFQAAIADASKALELRIAAADDAYTVRGTAKAGLGDYDAAMADCNRALKINPKHALAYNNRANNKLRKFNYSGALADCNKSIALNPGMALPYYNRGFASFNLGNSAGALADWKKAVQMQPSFGAELNPKIAQLEAQGVRPKQKTPPKTSEPPPGEWVDLTNAPQKIIGTWQGGRHRTQYFADGTFVTDPHLVPNPPRGQWQVQGDRLVEYFPQANTTMTHNILSLDGKTLVLRNAQGETFRKTRISK